MAFELVMLVEYFLLDLLLRSSNKIVLFEKNIVGQQPKCPYIYLRSISFLSEQLRWHEDWSAYNFGIKLFFDCEPEISQFEYRMMVLFLHEYVVRFDVSMDHSLPGNKLQASRKLV